MLYEEIKTDLDFLKKHDLQPKWWKFGKIIFLVTVIIVIFLFFNWKSTIIWLSTIIFCMGIVHFIYRYKTKKYTVAWADFRVDSSDTKRKFGSLYYVFVSISFIIATILMLLLR